jgi:hypothetical protein
MYAGGTGRMLVKVASLWPVADASGEQVDRNGLMRYRTPGASSPDTWSTPITGYGEFEGLRLPVRGPAIWELPGEDYEYIEVTITRPASRHRRGSSC